MKSQYILSTNTCGWCKNPYKLHIWSYDLMHIWSYDSYTAVLWLHGWPLGHRGKTCLVLHLYIIEYKVICSAAFPSSGWGGTKLIFVETRYKCWPVSVYRELFFHNLVLCEISLRCWLKRRWIQHPPCVSGEFLSIRTYTYKTSVSTMNKLNNWQYV